MIQYQRPISLGAVVGLSIALAVLFVQQQRSRDLQQQHLIQGFISQLEQLDARFEKQILLIDSRHFRNYDTLNNIYDAYSDILVMPPELPPELKGFVPVLRNLLEQKFERVERLKSSNAVLRNSVNYLPNSAHQMYQELDIALSRHEITAETERLFRFFLNYRISRQLSARSVQIPVEQGLPQPDLNQLPVELRQKWVSLLRHLQRLTEQQRIIVEQHNQLESIHMGRQILLLSQGFSDHLKLADQTRREQTNLLFVYVGIGFVILLLFGLLLRSYHRQHQEQTSKALSDPLTGLGNRRQLKAKLPQYIDQARKQLESVGILFVDLDGFKQVNDTLGHQYGDSLLQQIALELQQAFRESDLVVRIGGDEFVIVICNSNLQLLIRAAEDVLNICVGHHGDEREKIPVSASIGISCYPDDGINPESLLQHADQAMYRAKQEGKGCYRFYEGAS